MRGGSDISQFQPEVQSGLNVISVCLLRYCSLLFAAFFLNAVLSASLSHANDHENAIFVIGNWVGKAHFNDKGRLNSCTMRALYTSGTEIYFVLNDKSGWALGINNKKWNMRVNETHKATIQIDQKPPVIGNARVISSQGFYILFDQKSGLLEDLKRGEEMVVYLNEIRKYELKGTSKAIEALKECVMNRINLVVKPQKPNLSADNKNTDAPANSGDSQATASLKKPDNPAADEKKRQEIISSIEKYLVQQGIVKFTILKVTQHPKHVDYDVMWKSANKDYGGVKIITDVQEKNIDKLSGQIIAHDAGMCTGEFASIKKLAEQASNEPSRSITTVCRNIANTREIQYHLYARKNGSFVKIAQSLTTKTESGKDPGEDGIQRPGINPDRSIIDSLPK
ncbi:MAG: hypothetical protein ACRBBN_16490 [Methyloligellaceae bacterium]